MIYLYLLLLIPGSHGDLLWISNYLKQYKSSIVSRNATPECATQRDAYFHGIANGDDWARQMLDATGKIPPAIIKGNVFDLGYYDECVDVKEEVNGTLIMGNYCLYGLAIPQDRLLNSTTNFTSMATKTKSYVRRIWRFETVPFSEKMLLLSLCIPDKCTPSDVVGDLGIDVSCETKGENQALDCSDIACLVFIAVILSLMTISTAYDVYLHHYGKKAAHPIYLVFSVYTNGKKILAVSNGNNPNQILCLDGIRSLSLFWIMARHTDIYMKNPMFVVNMEDAVLLEQNWYMLYLPQAVLAVDSFLFLSGILLSYNFLKSMDKPNAKFNIFSFYIHRYIRLTPSLAAAYFVTITIVRRLSSGPLWTVGFESMRNTCLDNWWVVFFYFANYIHTDICVPHWWYLGLDMQLFVVSPLVLLPLWKFRKQMLLYGLPIMIFASLLCPFLVLLIKNITLFSTVFYNVYYGGVHMRFAPWLIGIAFGVLLLKVQRTKLKIDRFLNITMWVFALVIMGVIVFTEYDVVYSPNKWKTAFYFPLSKAAWSLCLGWIIVGCVVGSGGVINWFLSIPVFQVFSKLSYSIYMVHLTVLLMIFMHRRTKMVNSGFENTYQTVAIIVVSIFVAFFWILAFELPILTLEKIIFGGGYLKTKQERGFEPRKNNEII